MQDSLLQPSFSNVIVQRSSRLPQEEREPIPVLEQMADGLAQPGVGLDPLFLELRFQPSPQTVHHRPAPSLMKAEALSESLFIFLYGGLRMAQLNCPKSLNRGSRSWPTPSSMKSC